MMILGRGLVLNKNLSACRFFIGLLIMIWVNLEASSQNLVSNGSFEAFIACPENFESTPKNSLVEHWMSPNYGTPDYFNACSYKCGVPNNWVGTAEAFDGKAYMGIVACMEQLDQNQIGYREYIRSELTQPLISGQKYFASMQIRLGLSCNISCNGLGMYFTSKTMNTPQTTNYPVIPQIDTRENVPILNKELWIQVCGTFTAQGDEKYLIIGNFLSDQQIKHVEFDENLIPTQFINRSAYFFIDQVTLTLFNDTLVSHCPSLQARSVANFEGSLQPNEKMVLKNLYFETDKAEILPASYPELNELFNALQMQPHLKINILGHTDNIGTEVYNQALSEKRAQAVQNYLITKGISKLRIDAKGLGATQPVSENNSDEGRATNRRVEIEVF